MRVLWHSNGPEDCTGFGRQTALWVPLLAALGHEVAVSAFHGAATGISDWRGFRVYPGGDDPWGMDVVGGHYRHFGADLLITLQDMWPCDPAGFAGLNVAHWVPVDCEPLGAGDKRVLEAAGGRVLSMSAFGHEMLLNAGFEPAYVPHGIDTRLFTPILPAGRSKLRKLIGIDDRFVIGINAANQDQRRKSFPQQFLAFRQFRDKHDDALLLVHTRADNRVVDGLDLGALARECDLEPEKDLMFSPQYLYRHGLMSDEDMANWYRLLDVLSMPSHGEGFGLPLIEAQACGVPVITTRASAMTELCGAGWLADSEPYWLRDQEAWWAAPRVSSIVRRYEQAYKEAGKLGEPARKFAEGYYVRQVLARYWEPALAGLATTGRPS
jgi:glycosyltransferase involved in cell wall biosynthesis